MYTPVKRSRLNQKQVLPQAPSKPLRSAGGGAEAGGVRGRNKFSALLSEEDASPVSASKAATVVKPVVSLEIEDTGKWGEDEYVPNPCTDRWVREVESHYWDHKPIVYPEAETPTEIETKEWCDLEEELWFQPFAADLEYKDQAQDIFDCRGLTDAAYAEFMTYLYENGWDVLHEERRWVQATTGDFPPRVWVPSTTKATIPIFCKAAQDCFTQGCRYVHADTIPKVKEECKFGASCGASDPTGAKRALCIRIHPGETWTPELCVFRHLPHH